MSNGASKKLFVPKGGVARTAKEKELIGVQARIASGRESAGELKALRRREILLKAETGRK